jgi:hypothetical protein
VNAEAPTARRLWAALQLLDRQLRCRDQTLCGKVDDLELKRDDETGAVYVTAILSGPGRLVGRFGHRRLGDWLVRFARQNTAGDGDTSRIPFEYAHAMGPVIELAVDPQELASSMSERWTREHVISHIPGSRHEA